MPSTQLTTIAEYIKAASPEAQPHLRRLYSILKIAAPKAEETIKWGNPIFVEPRFLFAFSAHKAHVRCAPTAAALALFREELKARKTTKNFLQVPYDKPFPGDLIRRIAEYRVQVTRAREDDAF